MGKAKRLISPNHDEKVSEYKNNYLDQKMTSASGSSYFLSSACQPTTL